MLGTQQGTGKNKSNITMYCSLDTGTLELDKPHGLYYFLFMTFSERTATVTAIL